jgi:N-methylhydantoinase A
VPVASLRGAQDMAALIDRFHDAHRRRYGHMAQAEAVEIVNFEVTAVGLIPKPAIQTFDAPPAGAQMEAASAALRQAYFNGGDACEVPVLSRSALSPGLCIAGPAVIEEKTSTTVLYPGQRATVDAYLNIEIEIAS